jgi:hypothetical protein
MKEQDIINLGFEKEYGENESFYYYTLDIGGDFPLTLISPANDEIADDSWWYVTICNHESIKFKERDQLRDFIYLLNNL